MHSRGDDIGDRLRFAGPGRALDDEVASGPDGFDDARLRGVRIDNMNACDRAWLLFFLEALMVRDLEPGNWPDNILASHPLLRGLLSEGFAAEPPILPEAAKLDNILHPAGRGTSDRSPSYQRKKPSARKRMLTPRSSSAVLASRWMACSRLCKRSAESVVCKPFR